LTNRLSQYKKYLLGFYKVEKAKSAFGKL